MNRLPSEPAILLSYINMKLRDFYPSLNDLVDDLDINLQDLLDALKPMNVTYDPNTNRFA